MSDSLRSVHAAALACVLGAAAPAGAPAQAVCSAPHSSPVLAGGGTIATLSPGAGWVQVSVFRQVSRDFFNIQGKIQPFLDRGRARTASLYLTGAVGLVRGLDAWLQVPLHDAEYVGQSGEFLRSGLGDPRFSVRVSPRLVGVQGVPLALRAGAKLPGTEFPVDATIIPLGEGQRDWEVSLETGTAFGSLPLYVLGWVGYRWRDANVELNRVPGDERFAHLAAGGTLHRIHAELAVEYMSGLAPRYLGVEVATARRRLVQLTPTVGYELWRGTAEVTALLPLAGRNLPAGPGLSVGYRLGWGAR